MDAFLYGSLVQKSLPGKLTSHGENNHQNNYSADGFPGIACRATKIHA